MKHSTLLLRLNSLSDAMVKYTLHGEISIKSHHIPYNSTFDYKNLMVGKLYVVKCVQVDGVWHWELAMQVDPMSQLS
jgi:hypothetical protein